jgi:diguanylate cyclase (GGDEF)-like protein
VRDYTVVEYDSEGLAKTIKGYLLDNTAEVEAQLQIERISYTDLLTNLANRQKLQIDIRDTKPYGCVVFNINRFREINDLFGVNIGDSLLVQIADWFATLNLEMYRIGGDEFAMLIYEKISWESLESNIEQWLEQLSQTFFSY